MDGKKHYTQVVCPKCGERFKVRILDLKGELRYSVLCRKCKTESVVEMKNL